ncbi:hypothetical protein Syn8016DRAFT_0583 [Synechococcus sp. WH 8016]|nr:hypothetical protein Syn8016DRAFT_0583 [Synechococcus sp. WH 8016]
MFIEHNDFIFAVLASSCEALNRGLEEFNLVEAERDRLMA